MRNCAIVRNPLRRKANNKRPEAMRIILLSKRPTVSRTLSLGRWPRALLSVCCLGMPLGLFGLGYYLALAGQPGERGIDMSLGNLRDNVDEQSLAVRDLRVETQRKLRALSMSVAAMEARLLRLDAMGQYLTSMAGLDDGEFDFDQPPALGGPAAGGTRALEPGAVETEMARLDALIADREQQLEVLQSLLAGLQFADAHQVSGRPVDKGWIASDYGWRTAPFTGAVVWHEGVDFAGKAGADVIAVASGVVTWAGSLDGYGEMVEISHSGGYATRYAHNQENLVEVGDLVKKGEVIALMGSTGRSTGPHVHYEVYKHGRTIDPASYIAHTPR